MTAGRRQLAVGVDARSLLCREPRGEGKTLLRLYQEIARIDPGMRVIFFGDEHGHAFSGELPPGVEVELLSSRGSRFDAWENLRLPWAALSGRCDVLHCTSSGAPLWSLTPMLLTVHDLIPMLVDDGQSVAAREYFKRRLARGMVRAVAVIAVSQNTCSDLARAFPARADKASVVYWGAPARRCHAATHANHGLRRYMLAYGGTAPRKNTAYTLERFGAVASQLEGMDLVFLGISSDTQRAEIDAQAARLGIAGRVELPGFVDEDRLEHLLSGAEMVLYLSRYEGFGLPLLEAVAHGVAVVASNSGSIQEVLGDSESCHSLDDPGAIESAIVRIATDLAYRDERIRAQARATARFDWHATATQTLALLHKAAAR